MKHLFLTAVLYLFSTLAFAESGTCNEDGSCTWSLDENGVLSIDGEIQGYHYGTQSNYPWYAYKEKIFAVTITNATSVPNYAFSNYSNLADITLPDTLESIGDYAFVTTKITNIHLPDGTTVIGDWAFSGLKLTEIELPDSLLDIEHGAFNSTKITSLTIPPFVTSIPYDIFADSSTPISEIFCSKAQIEQQICSPEKFKNILPGYYEDDMKTANRIFYSPDGQDNDGNIQWKVVKKESLCKDITSETGAILTVDPEGNIRGIRGKKIYTVEEAEKATAYGTKFHVGLTYK